MWMIGCGESNSLSISDSLHSVKLRPLIARPVSSSDVAYRASSLSLISGTDFLTSDAYKSSRIEHNKPPVSSRWNPTPEQLRTLEDLYQRGTRTPTAEQIRHITAQLRRFGKIEGKNVFYWFQNHKARERQKRRRRSEASLERELEKLQCKDLGSETQECKNLSRPTNYSRVAEEPASLPTSTDTESRNEKWTRCNTDIHSMELHPKWLSSTFSTKETNSEKDLINHENVDIFMVTSNENESGKSQILELFPLRSGGGIRNEKVVSSWIEVSNSMEMSRSSPQKFFEFL